MESRSMSNLSAACRFAQRTCWRTSWAIGCRPGSGSRSIWRDTTTSLPNLAVPAYKRLDARLGYRPRQDLEISLSGQNLQGGRHAEFISDGPYPRVTIGRSVMVTLTWGF